MNPVSLTPIEREEKINSIHAEVARLNEAIIRATELAVISTTPEGIITSFNKAAEKLTGYSAVDVVGKVTPTIFYDHLELLERTAIINAELGGDLDPGFSTFTARLKENDDAARADWTFIRKDKVRLPVSVSVAPLLENELLIGYVFIGTDITERKKTHRIQDETQAQLQALIASIDDIVFEVDAEGRFNKIWVKSDENLFLPREKIYGRTLTEMFGHEFAAPFEAGIKKVAATGETFTWEYPSLKQSENRWYSAKCSLIFENGQPSNRISVCIQNISDRKNIEISLRESEEKFRLLAENIPGVVFILRNDEDNSLIYANAEIEHISGYSAQEFYSGATSLASLIHESDKQYIFNLRERSLEDKTSYHAEYRIRHRQGHWGWVSETGIAISGQEKVLQGFMADITRRKESEDELRRMADENSRIFNNSITMTALATFDGYFKRLNPAWERTLGWSRDEMITRPFTSFLHPDDVSRTEEIMRVIRTGHTVTMSEIRYRCKDGSYRWLLWSYSPDLGRKIIYATAIDITSRKKSEEEVLLSKRNLEVAAFELEEQNRQLDEFAHIISHNLRAPVANIKALLNFLNDGSQISDYQLIFEKIRNVTHNIAETMNELLETIKIKKNQEIERVEIRFKDTLAKVVQSLEGELIESGATVTYNFNNAPKIYYSKPYLESILQNLISNAVKYRSPNRIPEIFVSTDLAKSGIELRVQDNGLGIDLEKFGKKLFGLHKTFHGNEEAKGVGLFLTKTQIETLGGTIIAESQVDKGTTFIIQF